MSYSTSDWWRCWCWFCEKGVRKHTQEAAWPLKLSLMDKYEEQLHQNSYWAHLGSRWSAALFPMLSFVTLTLTQRMPTPAPGCGYNPDLAPAEQCQTVQHLVCVCSGSARPSPARVLIPVLSEDPALNSSCNTGKHANWGIFYIINSDEQPPHLPSPLSLFISLCPTLSSSLISFLMFLFFFSEFLTFSVSPFILSYPKHLPLLYLQYKCSFSNKVKVVKVLQVKYMLLSKMSLSCPF